MSIRNRIEALESVIGWIDSDNQHERERAFIQQLDDISDAELDRLEQIVQRTMEITGDEDRCFAPPADCNHLCEFIAYVDADEDAYFAAVAEAYQ